MNQNQYPMALYVDSYREVTVEGATIHAVPGDVIVDSPEGKRVLMHRIDFDRFVEQNGYTLSGDRGMGWVACRR